MTKVITEITPLSDNDFFYLVDRTKDSFSFPIHRHEEFELNFVEHCKGATRVVGDSVEELGEYDLCLVGHGIEHAWLQNNCTSHTIREITIQVSPDILSEPLLKKNRMSGIRELFKESSKGIAFSMDCILRVFHLMDRLLKSDSKFEQMLDFLRMLNELSKDQERRVLSSSGFSKPATTCYSRRIQKVQDYIESHYSEKITLEDLAKLANMATTSFSRFFKLRTGRSVQDYIVDVRLGHAIRELMDSTTSVAEICYACGFNNISNFNRIFKRKKNYTPSEFRELYQRNKVII